LFILKFEAESEGASFVRKWFKADFTVEFLHYFVDDYET
jgi:hypothetical protein